MTETLETFQWIRLTVFRVKLLKEYVISTLLYCLYFEIMLRTMNCSSRESQSMSFVSSLSQISQVFCLPPRSRHQVFYSRGSSSSWCRILDVSLRWRVYGWVSVEILELKILDSWDRSSFCFSFFLDFEKYQEWVVSSEAWPYESRQDLNPDNKGLLPGTSRSGHVNHRNV